MVKVDRKYFVPEDMVLHAYSDMPRPIGWNTTISAPHMHAMTLEKLQDALVPGGKALDIGTGSGYIAACFAEMMGKSSMVYMIDHIKDITDFALNNIKKGNRHLLRSKRIIALTQDGRKGLPEHGPYNVIHVGGAMDHVPPELEQQLAPGGKMWIPVGPLFCQAIYVISKDADGNMHKDRLMEVRYGSLTSVEQQLDDE
jgi:protein-L-isoaspartate(D-aspartate) O-methyltransferase